MHTMENKHDCYCLTEWFLVNSIVFDHVHTYSTSVNYLIDANISTRPC